MTANRTHLRGALPPFFIWRLANRRREPGFVLYIIYQNFAPIFENAEYIIHILKLYIIYFEKTIDTGAIMLYNVLKKRQGGHQNVHHFHSQVYAPCTGYRSPL